MRKVLLTVGLIATVAGCGRESKPQQATQAHTTSSAFVPDQTREPGVQASSSAPASAPVNSAPAPASAQSALPTPNPAQPNGSAKLPVEQQVPPPQLSGSQPVPTPEPAPPIAIPAGTLVRVRLAQTIDTKRNRAGDRFEATLISPIEVHGNFLLPVGTTFEGHVTEARPSGRFRGRAVLGVELDSFRLDGAVYRVVTAPATRVCGRHRKCNWILMGGGAGFGAAVGAVAGGCAGALMGAGAGAGAGAVGAFFTGRKNVSLPIETPLTFRLRTEVALSDA